MDWLDLNFFSNGNFKHILTFLRAERNKGKVILPSLADMLNAFVFTSIEQTKVIILGQDCYPGRDSRGVPYATGLAFSVPSNSQPIPKSLVNIFKELECDIGVRRLDGNLESWANQGVLLLNTSLSVEEGRPNSHSEIGWQYLTNEVIVKLSEEKEHLVFILWGQHAISKARLIDDEKHSILTSAHPSPLSAHRGFFKSAPFSKTNRYLRKHKIEEIDW